YYLTNRKELAGCLLDLGEHCAAAAAAEQIVELPADPAEVWDIPAGILARCAARAAKDDRLTEDERRQLSQAYADRAVALLRQAVRKGYRDLKDLKTNRDFDALRGREDFRALLVELESRPKDQGPGPK